VTSADVELGLTALAAMVSPTTLTFTVFALVLGKRPLRTGLWFFIGAFGATVVIGVVAAFVIGAAAAPSHGSENPPTAVAILDVVFAVLLIAYVIRALRRPPDPRRQAGMVDRMTRVASSPAIAVVGAGATLANPGGFIPIALKSISQLNPSAAEYIVLWVGFALVSLLPLVVSLISLAVAPEPTRRALDAMHSWLERRARTVAFVLILLVAAALLRNGIVALTA
jgi:Sap, sulfolipid-1-addressing protein